MRRMLDYLRRADVRRDPFRLVGRRLLLEAERRFAPGRYDRERVVRLPGGLLMSVRASDQIERAIYLFGLYEYVSATAFARLVFPGATVVDAGAHGGQYTLLAARRAGDAGLVLAVEPHPGVRARLERNVRINALANVRVEGVALSDAVGRARLMVQAGENTGTSALAENGEIDVETITLDALLDRAHAPGLDIVKMDVEGLEARVVAGGAGWIARHKPAIVFEANAVYHGDASSDPVVAALEGLGYELYGIRESGLRRVSPGQDLRVFRDYYQSLNLAALHPERAAEFLR